MQTKTTSLIGLILWLGIQASFSVPGPSPTALDFALQVSARVQADPAQITLTWRPSDDAFGYAVSRKRKDDSTWAGLVSVPSSATSYVDTDVTLGDAFEYHVQKTASQYNSHAYIYAGVEVPLVEARGKIVLLVDSTMSSNLAAQLERLAQDLVGDGWTVLRHDVLRTAVDPGATDPNAWLARSNEVSTVKNLVRSDYLADPAHVRALFIFGHVPVPYSGRITPDQHGDHRGAWPADGYYGDMTGIWSDSSVSDLSASDPRNHNVPNDGKFDQSQFPFPLALEVGRVDLANLPTFGVSETDLLSRYLDKDHQFRQHLLTIPRRALVQDELGILNGEVPATDAWNNFAPLVGSDQVTAGRWLAELTQNSYLWAYGSGAGTYTGAAGVANTSHFLAFDFQVVFTFMFGSYFGDWDSPDNFLRAPLAGSSYTLASAWAGRPNWYVHHMGLGETIGYSTRLSQNNSGLYQSPYQPSGLIISGLGNDQFTNQVHASLMGDPSLRLHPVPPPFSFDAVERASGGVDLHWASPGLDVLGFHVYRARTAAGPFVRLNDALVSGNTYLDPETTSDRFYMVRAVKLENSSSGSYYNMSQGALVQATLIGSPSTENTWAPRGTQTWRMTDAAGSAGSDPGWDWVQLGTALNITATSSNQFTIRIVSSGSDHTLGPPANFDPSRSYTWPILTAASPISGFDPAQINLITTDFQGDLRGGLFSLGLSSDSRSINLIFTPNHPPTTSPVSFTRPWDTPLQINIADLLTHFTSDSDGDARALVQVGSSTNGTSITSDGTMLQLTSTNNLAETISFWVQDVRDYRPGDTIQMATGSIRVIPTPEALPISAYHAIEIQWQGEPGKLYQIQSRLETEAQWSNQGDPFLGTGELKSLFERTSNLTKFYRVILLE